MAAREVRFPAIFGEDWWKADLERAGSSGQEAVKVACAWMAEIGAERDLVNPNGGAIALGHPLGGSGARLMTTMLHQMEAENIRYGLQAMCEGGGTANATIIELIEN
ncbi:MAG: hypothetical protein JSS97_12520 [Actinobacteria bacterium]|nr:hypothetical protein [Actinomycetota bacterium]